MCEGGVAARPDERPRHRAADRRLRVDPSHPRMSGVMEDLVSTIKQLSDSPDNLRQLLSTLQQREDQLIQMLPQLDDAMQALTPSLHTLGLIFILYVQPGNTLLRTKRSPLSRRPQKALIKTRTLCPPSLCIWAHI